MTLQCCRVLQCVVVSVAVQCVAVCCSLWCKHISRWGIKIQHPDLMALHILNLRLRCKSLVSFFKSFWPRFSQKRPKWWDIGSGVDLVDIPRMRVSFCLFIWLVFLSIWWDIPRMWVSLSASVWVVVLSLRICGDPLDLHRETMGLEGGVYLYHQMTPPSNLGHSWVVFEGWSQILLTTKLFRHEFEQSCSAMATQKLEEKVQQHDEVVESSKTGCRSQSRAHGKA